MKDREQVRAALRQRLDPSEPVGGVTLLTGPWGSGKTFLWKDVAKELPPDRVVYVSLFGSDSVGAVKTAIMNASLLSRVKKLGKGDIKGAFNDSGRFIGEVFKKFFQGVDGVIGANVLSRNLDPLRLVEHGLTICMDDVERISANLQLVEVLGLANLLAETMDARVLLVMNNEHLQSRGDTSQEQFNLYKERVVGLELRTSADTDACYDLFLSRYEAKERSKRLLLAAKERVLRLFARTKTDNMRTLQRVIAALAAFAEADGVEFPQSHIDTLAALILEAAAGRLEHQSFYDFQPLAFLFGLDPKDDEGKRRVAYHSRYFERGDARHVSVPVFYQFVTSGYFDVEAARLQLSPPRVDAPRGRHLTDQTQSEEWYFYTDKQYLEWVSAAAESVREDELAMELLVTFLCYIELAVQRARLTWPADLQATIQGKILQRAHADDRTFNELKRMMLSEMKNIWREFVAPADEVLKQIDDQKIQQEIEQAIDKDDLTAIGKAITGRPSGLSALLCPECIKKLVVSYPEQPRLVFRTIQMAKEELKSYEGSGIVPNLQDLSSRLDEALRELFAKSDNSGRFRLQPLVGESKKPEPSTTSDPDESLPAQG